MTRSFSPAFSSIEPVAEDFLDRLGHRARSLAESDDVYGFVLVEVVLHRIDHERRAHEPDVVKYTFLRVGRFDGLFVYFESVLSCLIEIHAECPAAPPLYYSHGGQGSLF